MFSFMRNNNTSTKFKIAHSSEERLNESRRIRDKYPDRIPIICEKSSYASANCPTIDKIKYLVPSDLTIGQFIYIIRKRLRLKPEEALYLLVNGFIPTNSAMMYEIYESYKDEDGVVYFNYCLENVFG
jgi:GABA(A) receptor-associated protein